MSSMPSSTPNDSKLYRAVALALLAAGCAGFRPVMAVQSSLVDLRAQPHTTAQDGLHDPLQESQLLYGERVRMLRKRDGWAFVEALEQPEFSHARRWQGYPGWVPAEILAPWSALSAPTIVVTDAWAPTWEDAYHLTPSPWRFPLGTKLQATDMGGTLWRIELLDGSMVWMPRQSARSLDELGRLPAIEKRRAVVRGAAVLVGEPYYWGGRSPSLADRVAGVDCSALVNLAYRSSGIDIPRDAHEQFLRAKPTQAPGVADLIFLSEAGHQQRIVHVMLYAGNGEVIEGPGTGLAVRRIALTERLSRPLERLAPGDVVNGQTVWFGTYFPSERPSP